jgi:hypothetical protein
MSNNDDGKISMKYYLRSVGHDFHWTISALTVSRIAENNRIIELVILASCLKAK